MSASSQGPVFTSGLCRCCGTMRQWRLFTLADEYESPNFGKEIYSKMIMDCFGLVISYLDTEEPTDHLICSICVRYLRIAAAFKKQVLRCEQAFLQVRLSDKIAEEPVRTFFSRGSTVTEIKAEVEELGSPRFDDDDTMETGPAEDMTATLNNIKQSETQTSGEEPTTASKQSTTPYTKFKMIKSNKSKTLNIKNKPKVYKKYNTRNAALKNNLVKNEDEILIPNHSEVSYNSSDAVNVDEYYSCDICDYTTLDLNALDSHLKAHAVMERFQCDMCTYVTTKKENIISHIDTHNKAKPFSHTSSDAKFKKSPYSEQVSQKYTRKHTMKIKKTCDTGDRPYSCHLCNSRFVNPSGLKVHQRIHTGERPYPCDVCGSSFRILSNLKAHQMIHTGEKPYSCDMCPSSFSAKSTLKRHMTTHTGVKPFFCDICHLRFTNRTSFKLHHFIHTGEKPYACDICHFRSIWKASLESHMRLHTGEKPFPCNFCDLRFCNTRSFRRHQREKHTHVGEKPFSCGICRSKFTRRATLKKHKATHTHIRKKIGKKLFSCDICHKKFSTSVTLKNHEATHRNNIIFL